MKAVPWLAAATLVSACATVPQPPPASAPSGSCNAAAAQFAVGRAHSEALAEAVRQRSGAASARVLRPGQIVTMEFSPERINIDVDASGVVNRVRCG